MRRTLFAFMILLLSAGPALANHQKANVPRAAEPWDIAEWINGEATSLEALKGKVVLIDFFQLWCPGCNKFTMPLIKHWQQVFADDIGAGRLEIVSIHTVFEGHDYQNPKRLKRFLKEKDIHHLVGVDRHKKGEFLPETMRTYQTRGTPEVAMIDKLGQVRFQQFGGFDVEKAERLLRALLAE